MRIIWCMIPEIWSAIGRNFYQFGTFTPLTTQKIKILKKRKNHLYIFNKCYSYNHMMYDSWNMERNRKYFCHFGSFFAFSPSSPLKKFKKAKKKKKNNKKSEFWKNAKNYLRYHHFTYMYQKLWSHDVWFLRYGVKQTEFFVILGHFLSFCPITNLVNQNF